MEAIFVHHRTKIISVVLALALLSVSIGIAALPVRAVSTTVVISQVYGGGGNSSAPYKNDFVELYNLSGTAVSVDGWSIQYASATGTSWAVTSLSGTIQPGKYYLVQEAAGTSCSGSPCGTDLPTPDATGPSNMSGTVGKVALVNNTTPLSCGATNNCLPNANIVDFVGYGATAGSYEGTGRAPAPSNTTADFRKNGGATDTDDNAADFTTGAPTPRNSQSGLPVLGSVNPSVLLPGTATLFTVAVTPATNPASTGIAVTCNLSSIGGAASQSFYDDGSNGDVTAGDNTFSFGYTVPAETTAATKHIPCTASDAQFRTGSTEITLYVLSIMPIGTVNGPVADTDDGAAHQAAHKGDVVAVQGVIYEKTLQPIKGSTDVYYGFFIQNTITTTDGISNTSDGLYVFMNTTPTMSAPGATTYTPIVGHEVVLSGSVSEYYNMTELTSPTLLAAVVRSGVDLDDEIAPFVADPPANLADANRYWERRQGMRGQVPQNSIVLNGRNVFNPPDGEIWLARSDSTIAGRVDAYARRAFRDAHPLDDNYSASTWDGNGYRILMGSWGIKFAVSDGQALITPARTFSTLTSAPVGGVNYSYSKYRIEVTAQPTFTEGVDPAANNPPPTVDRSQDYSIVDYNLENLYDYRNDPFSGCDFAGDSGCSKYGPFQENVTPPYDYVPPSDAAYQARLTDIANQIITDLRSPDILMLQEVENQDICTVSGSALACGSTNNADGKPDVLQELALKIASLGGPAYDAAFDRDSSDLRGIVPAFMYRTDRVQLPSAVGDPVLGANPAISYAGAGVPANGDASNPKTLNAVLPGGVSPCETNWVFPRAPDVGLFRIYQTSVGVGGYRDVYVINNHFKSTPTDCVGHRTEQAKYNAAIVQFIQNAKPHARIVVGGDLNVYPRPDDPFAPIGELSSSDQLGALYDSSLGLKNLWEVLKDQAPASAYSYVYVGMAQTLDQMFVNQAMLADLQQFRIAHINSDFAADNPGDGARGTSDHDPNVAIFTLLNATPTLTSISPTTAQAGGPAFTLTLTGTNFVNNTTARWNGADLTTSFVSSTQLTATVPASHISNVGTANVTVFNPAPGGGTSSPQTFTIGQTNTSFHLTVSPSSVLVGQPITFTATLTQVYGASARVRGPRDVTPSGIVTFTLDSTTTVTRTMGAAGVLTYVTNTIAVGPHTMRATYSGDANLVSTTSETVPFLVGSRTLFFPFTSRNPAFP